VTLEGKVAAITGAGSGMGRAAAELFANQGAPVVVADINVEAAESVAAGIRAAGGQAVGIQTDVSSASDVEVASLRKMFATFDNGEVRAHLDAADQQWLDTATAAM